MKKLRILHVYRTYFPDPPGGLQEAIRQISISTCRFGIESSIFSLSPNPIPSRVDRPEGVVFREKSWVAPASCDLGGLASLRLFSKLAASVDVIHYHFPWPFCDLLHMFGRIRVPAVMTYHSDIVRQRLLGALYSPLMLRTLKNMAAIVATSPAYASTSSVLTNDELRSVVRVIPLGIDEGTFQIAGNQAILNRLGIEDREPFFLFIGVLRYYKGLHTLLEAAKDVGAKIVVAGTGPESLALGEEAKRLELNNVIFAGQVSDTEKVALLKGCRAFVLPSHLRSEAFGMVLVEASMFQKPMISCEIGTGTSFVNAHGETGFVVPPENPVELSRAMNQMLADDSLVERFGLAARGRYDRLFSGEALGSSYASLYREVVGDH